MEAKYVQAIKAGIIGGVVVGFLVIVNFMMAVIASWSTVTAAVGLLNCCIFIIIVIAMAGIGALGVRMASSVITTLSDAILVSAITGAIAGLISAIIYFIISILSPWLTKSNYYSNLYSYGYSQSTFSMLGAFGSACCCGPVILVIAIVLAVIGGAIYAALALKVS